MEILFHPEAVDEAAAARQWYEERSSKAAAAFEASGVCASPRFAGHLMLKTSGGCFSSDTRSPWSIASSSTRSRSSRSPIYIVDQAIGESGLKSRRRHSSGDVTHGPWDDEAISPMTSFMHGPHALQFLLATFAGWVNRQQQQVIDYLIEENRVLKEQLGDKRPRLTDDQRRRLAVKGKPLGRRLLDKIATIVTPDTILRWHRKLIAEHHTYPHKKRVGRPGLMQAIRKLPSRGLRLPRL